MQSILKNVIYLDIITSGTNSNISEIIEISAIKITDDKVLKFNTLIKPFEEVSANVFGNCKDLNPKDLENAPTIYQIKNKFLEFIEDYPIILYNLKFKKSFLKKFIYSNDEIKNETLDIMELAMILEPHHKDYKFEYLLNTITKYDEKIKNRTLNNCKLNIRIVNALLLRLSKKEELKLDKLYFNLDQYFQTANFSKWGWSKYLKDIDENPIEENYVIYKEDLNNEKNNHKVDFIKYKNSYEELLKIKELWSKSKNFSYTFRPRQYEFTKFIKDVFQSNEETPKIGCIEAPTGIGKSVGYLIPAIMESLYNNKNLIISTDTKNLQMQLINKDIPTILKSMNLYEKVKYGCMKGKNNYLCNKRLYEYRKNTVFKNKKELLQYIYIERLIQSGDYGDIEEIPDSVKFVFENIDELIYNLRCEPDICYPEKCIERCFYKKRVNELKKENITVINHSLLAKWPYKEQKQLDYLIIDEAHNLMEKSYDFFTLECDSKLLLKLMEDLYPHNEISHKNVSLIDKLYISFSGRLQLDPTIRKRLQEKIVKAKEHVENILKGCNKSLKRDLYNHSWEINRQQAPLNEFAKNNNIDISNFIRNELKSIVISLKEILSILNYIIDQCEKEGEDDSYIFNSISAKTTDIDSLIATIENFKEEILDNYCRVIDIDFEYKYFNIRVIPIDIADMFESMFLSNVNTVVFLSATLNINNTMKNFKNTLGLDKHFTYDRTIDSIYDYEGKTKIIAMDKFPKYNDIKEDFVRETADLIEKICLNSNGHILALFNSKNRLEKVHDILIHNLNKHNIELYKHKSSVNQLRDLRKKCVVLASKSCFEGIDIQGEGLTCVILDKLPNKSLEDPLYSSIRSFKKINYEDINYPQLSIKVKQAYGRLIRSKYDYGYFIILDIGNNNKTFNKLKTDLHNCNIQKMDKSCLVNSVSRDFKNWKIKTFKEILKDINCNIYNEDDILIKNGKEIRKIDFINQEVAKRNISLFIRDIDSKNKKIKISYK